MKEHEALVEKLRFDLKGNAADILAEKLKDMIISGEVEPGYLFPSENIFCEQLCVSRSTLREAYKALESTGFISRNKGHGTVVNDYSAIFQSAPFSTSVKMSDIDDIMDFREMVESELAKLAAERATGENIASMEAALERMVNNASSISKLTYYDTRFHMEIANASGNTLMISTMKNVEAAFSKGMYSAFHIDTDENIQQAIKYHTMILDAIKAKDSAMAQDLMRQHIRSVVHRLGVHRTAKSTSAFTHY